MSVSHKSTEFEMGNAHSALQPLSVALEHLGSPYCKLLMMTHNKALLLAKEKTASPYLSGRVIRLRLDGLLAKSQLPYLTN